ncbi:TetR/AcrR family transcriptional regulator [Magnetofaba australis]|uniref:Putative TetR family transcriptional regulator n=1 Tax=Magnetofaba australis IT-1 TaxID=1434232 RepID=A0A1Y2KC88_9PROT|nr:TetR/AcrR family transcriptional regulator [Magnetofaba australis]OSM07636.1 putative TetR family transcriptional regulator [Magnetofaba australis IT-1]
MTILNNPKEFSETALSILEHAIPLFAEKGYAGVSMREIAQAVGIRAATIYHHFPNKEALHLGAMALAFADKAEGMAQALSEPGTPQDRLRRLIFRFTELMSRDRNFRLLLQRELMDGDEARLKVLAEKVFKDQFNGLAELAASVSPGCDAHLLAISMAGLVLYHLETGPIRKFLPGGRVEHDDPSVIAGHVTTILLHGMGGCAKP